MTIILFHGIAGWTAAVMVAFGFGAMAALLEEEIEAYLGRGEARV